MLVVLDLNGTILDSTHRRRRGQQHDGMARYKYVYFRPGMREFIDWLFAQKEIEVGIWTSNIQSNAEALVKLALRPEQQEQLKFLYSRAQCELGPNYSSFKHVRKLFEMCYVAKAKELIIVDDSSEKIVPACSPCHYLITKFEAGINQKDNALVDLQTYIASRIHKVFS